MRQENLLASRFKEVAMARWSKLFGFIPIATVPETAAPTMSTPTPPPQTLSDEEKAEKEQAAAFAELRAEEKLQTAAAYREAAQGMRNARIARLQGGPQNP